MGLRDRASKKRGAKAGPKPMVMASAAPKRMAAAKKSAPTKKPALSKKPAPAKKPAVAKKAAAPAKKPAPSNKPIAAPAKPGNGSAPRPAPPSTSGATSTKPSPASPAPPRPAGSAPSTEERRRAATRKFFARLRSLEAIVGADLRKRGSVVLMQAVDQWYAEAINANATDVSITNAAKAVITHL